MNQQHIGLVMEAQNLLWNQPTKHHEELKLFLHIAEDSLEFLEEFKIKELLNKYNKFMPIPIKFGTKTRNFPKPEDAPEDYKTKQLRSRQLSSIIQIQLGQNNQQI